MAFMQFKNADELEEYMQKHPHGFISDDHRLYTEMTLADDACFYNLNSETVMALLNLQHHIQMVIDGRFENPFTEVAEKAAELESVFIKALDLVKFKPLKKRI